MLVLASGSPARAAMLRAAGVPFEAEAPRVDEDAVKAALLADGHGPRALADALAEMKALKVSARRPGDLVVGSDQVLDLDGEALSKPRSPEEARAQLDRLAGRAHRLHSAAVAAEGGRPVWRHVSEARLAMRRPSPAFLDAYVERNWPAIGGSVGAYLVEGEGVRLFERVDGDHWTVLGMPLLPLLSFLHARGSIPA